jgi:integrase
MSVFSDVGLRAIPAPESGQQSYWDDTLPSFRIRVSQGGSKTFVLKRQNRFITIGRFPLLSLSKARQEAKRLLAEFTLGRIRPQSLTYKEAVALYLEDKAKSRRSRTIRDYVRLLGRVSYGQLSDITHDSVTKALKPITAPSEYNHLVVALRIFFNWCIKRRYITHNPTSGISTHATTSRSRILADHEIIAIWKATEEPKIFHSIVRLLLLTGQRCGEVATLQTSWISSNNTITIPSSVSKNNRQHEIPIGALSATILASHAENQITRQKNSLLFPNVRDGSKPFCGWSKSKAALDKISGVENWTLHDLRRTYRSNLGRLGVMPWLAERMVNHVPSRSAMDLVYDRHTYLPEMREAVEKYEKWLTGLVADL